MIYLGLASVVALLHGSIVTAVVIGAVAAMGGLLRRHPRWELLYAALLLSLVLSDLLLGDCLLTRVEKDLRNLAVPGSAYRGSFIGHYFPWVPHFVHAYIGPALVGAGLLALPLWRWVERRERRRSAGLMG
jgi:hypothetical protein